jgi:DNA repair protein RadC
LVKIVVSLAGFAMMDNMKATALGMTTYVLHDHDKVVGEYEAPYVLRVRDLALQDKPREKMLAGNASDLSAAELIAILLGVGTRKEEVMAMANRILKEYGERAILNETDPNRLSETLQIPLGKACQIVACFELGRRYFAETGKRPVYVRTAQQAYGYLKGIDSSQKEQLRGLYLNSRYQVIHEEVISVGSLTANIVHPREVFQPAIKYGAVAVIIAHNHPSGILQPTEEDLEVTRQLTYSGKILGIDLLDHLIIADGDFVSIILHNE